MSGEDPPNSDKPPAASGAPSPRSGSVTLDPLIGRIVLERYEVLRRIGSGGMGAVYVGRQMAVQREIALKVLRADLVSNEHVRQRFRREAEIIGKLSHPNTIQLIDYGETADGLAIMAMELLIGQSLSERLRSHGPLSVSETLKLGEEVAGSLAEAHLIGLVHRDLKPANIMLTEVAGGVHAKVLDFGIARLLDEEATRLTSTGQVFGTPRYMSPEQAASTADVDPRSDLYSLGLILFECLAGQPPFVAQTSIQYLSAHTTQQPPRLSEHVQGAPSALEELIDACLDKDPDGRPQSAEAVASVLQDVRRALEQGLINPSIEVPRGQSKVSVPSQGGLTTGLSLTEPPPAQTKPPVAGRSFLPVVVGGVLGLALFGGLSYAIFQSEEPVPLAESVDMGAMLAAADTPDGGWAAVEVHDAGVLDVGGVEIDAGDLDAGAAEVGPVDTGRRRKRRDAGRRRKNPNTTKNGGDLGRGAVTGPRGLVINLGDEENDVLEAAKSCTASEMAGLSSMTTKRCPKGCAIIVDSLCAGRTPAKARPMPPGSRTVSVVCGGKVRRSGHVRFRENDNSVFRCK